MLQKFAEAGDQTNQDGASVHAQARSRITFLPETANFDAPAFERIHVQRLRVLGFCVSNEDYKYDAMIKTTMKMNSIKREKKTIAKVD